MLYIGLTGNIASGKSEVAKMLAEQGATIIDADVLAREAVARGTPAFERIIERWGREVLAPDGTLDRAELRHRVFADRSELDELNAIVHPEVTRLRDVALDAARARGDAVVVYVVPLLFERNLADEFDKIVLVDAPRPIRADRLLHTRGLDPADAMNMIAAQMPAELKRARVDVVIENEGTLEALRARVEAAWGQLTASEGRPSLAV